MSDLVVHPSVVVGPEDIITADLLNLLATPVVDLAIAEPVNDQNFLRNGNFYSSYWTTPAGMTHAVNTETSNADYWYVKPQGAAVTSKQSTLVPDTNSLFSFEIDGAVGVTDVEFGQHISGDLSSTLRRICTFSAQVFNSTGLVVAGKLRIYTCNAFNNFSAMTLRTTVDLQTCSNNVWTFVSATLDLGLLTNVANGISVVVLIPSGALTAVTKMVHFSRVKFQIGEVATEFTDDVSLFVQSPSVDSTMLQDGCIARPALFLPNVVPTGAYQAKSIMNGDIADGAINGRTLQPAVSTTLTAAFTQPAVSANISIAVVSTTSFAADYPVTIAVGGKYTVASVTDSTHMVVTNTGASGNAAPATNVPTSGAVVSTSTSAVVVGLGYVPINKAGDSNIGPGPLNFVNDNVVGTGTVSGAAAVIETSVANIANDGYLPAISFRRPGRCGRAIGLDINAKFKTVDNTGAVGFLLDSVTKVATADVQDKAITLAKLADSLVALLVAPGTVHQFAGPTPPTGWVVCDGTALSRITFAALFSAIGTYWGAGDNVNTFNIPNFVNRVPVGYGTGAAWGFGSTGGTSAETLNINQIPSHNHTLHDPQHSHVMQTAIGAGSNFQSGSGWLFGGTNTNAASTNITIDAAGGGGSHNNMPPYAVLYYIIKY